MHVAVHGCTVPLDVVGSGLFFRVPHVCLRFGGYNGTWAARRRCQSVFSHNITNEFIPWNLGHGDAHQGTSDFVCTSPSSLTIWQFFLGHMITSTSRNIFLVAPHGSHYADSTAERIVSPFPILIHQKSQRFGMAKPMLSSSCHIMLQNTPVEEEEADR
jgi:hypothetical protein